MTNFFWHAKVVEEALLLDIEEAKLKYGNFIKIADGSLHSVSNWLHGNLEYFVDYEYLIDYDNNHYIYFMKEDDLLWFILSNNLTNYTIHIE